MRARTDCMNMVKRKEEDLECTALKCETNNKEMRDVRRQLNGLFQEGKDPNMKISHTWILKGFFAIWISKFIRKSVSCLYFFRSLSWNFTIWYLDWNLANEACTFQSYRAFEFSSFPNSTQLVRFTKKNVCMCAFRLIMNSKTRKLQYYVQKKISFLSKRMKYYREWVQASHQTQ